MKNVVLMKNIIYKRHFFVYSIVIIKNHLELRIKQTKYKGKI